MVSGIEYAWGCRMTLTCDEEVELNKYSKNGISWESKYYVVGDSVNLHWKFEWDSAEQEVSGMKGYDGEVIVEYEEKNGRQRHKVLAAELKESGDCVTAEIKSKHEFRDWKYFTYKLSLSPTPIESFDGAFEPSQFTDTVLVVEGKKMHFNKTLLAVHSEFFRVLFSSNFKERTLAEIVLDDVKYDEFARLLSIILPKPYRLPEKHAESMLILADRFLMPKAAEHVELLLLGECKMRPVKRMFLAEQYNLDLLMERMLENFKTRAQLKALKLAPESELLSLDTKAVLYRRMLNFI